MIIILQAEFCGCFYSSFKVRREKRKQEIGEINDITSRYYIRTTVTDRPGVLGEITAIFGRHGFDKVNSVIFPVQGLVTSVNFYHEGFRAAE